MISVEQLGPAVDLRGVVAREREHLLDVLWDLRAVEWKERTACPGWRVRDVAAHLLHDDLRRLSRTRDQYPGGSQPQPGQGLAAFLHSSNQVWVETAAYLSPRLLTELLTATAPLIQQMWADSDLTALGEGVSWADVDPAPVWLDLAREYTEAWTHQQQIREATNRPGLVQEDFLLPALDTFVRALPHTYRDVRAAAGTAVLVTVDGDVCRDWSLRASRLGWHLQQGRPDRADASLTCSADTLWRLATGGIGRAEATYRVRAEGDPALTDPFLDLISVIR